jgi:N-acetylmuramoyl-L-alanine amidase
MKISIHAGHGKEGTRAHGAVGYCDESRYARKIIESMKNRLDGRVAYNDCTYNGNKYSQTEILVSLVRKINSYNPDFAISIHLNASNDVTANGVECLVHPNTSKDNYNRAEKLVNDLSVTFGFINRGVKKRSDLYILRKTKCPAIIIEVGFCTNLHDSKIIMENYETIGYRIADLLTNTDSKRYTVKVHNIDENTATKLTDIAYNAGAVYQKEEL